MSKTATGRLAMRAEGVWWQAYYAQTDTMKNAIPLGRVSLAACKGNLAVKNGFMDLMQMLVADIIEATMGERPTWTAPQTAPQHERAGTA